MIFEPVICLAAAGLLLACLSAIAARALAEFSPYELKEIYRKRKADDRLSQILKHRDRVALAMESLRVVAAAVFVAAGAFWIWGSPHPEWNGRQWVAAGILAVGAVLLLAAEVWLPWAVVRLWAEPFLYYTWGLWRRIGRLLAPLVWGARFVDGFLHRMAGRPHQAADEESFEDDIRTMVSEGHREGLLEEDAREMIEGVIELSDLDVSEIMTPRTDMVSVSKHLSWQEVLQFVVKAGHTRIPVIDKNRDDIVGMLVTKDLLPELASHSGTPTRPWTELLREPYFIPETKPIDALLQEFQQTRNHLAVVLDEYGGVSGLVTIEDVLEEIVGEIVDEYDPDLVDGIRELDGGTCEALGKVHIDEINERLDLNLPDDRDFDTVGGFVFSELGHVPAVGEELVHGNVRITVVEATPRRVVRVRIEVLDRPRRVTA